MESENKKRRYEYTLCELLDRLTINMLKVVKIPDHRKEYAQEIEDLLYDIQLILDEKKPVIDAGFLYNLCVIAHYNQHIWINESEARKGGKDGNQLFLTHGLNGIRCAAKNKIQNKIGGRKDYKLDCVEAFKEWLPAGYEENK